LAADRGNEEGMKSKPSRHFLALPFVPLLTAFIALYEALENDSIRQFFPTLWNTWKEWTLVSLARNSFWPEAGWCWRYEPSEGQDPNSHDWTAWNKRFVLHDPVEADKLGWTWSDDVSDHEYAWKEMKRREVAAKEQKK
jgi:hypothetical protein